MSTKTAFVSARIESLLKKKAGKVLSQMGMSHSEAIEALYRRIANDKKVPFSLHTPNTETNICAS